MAPKRNAKRKSNEEHVNPDPSDDDVGRGRTRQKQSVKRAKGESLSRLAGSGDNDALRDDSRKYGSLQSWGKWIDDISKNEEKFSKEFMSASEENVDKQTEQLKMLMKQGEDTLKGHRQKVNNIVNQLYMESTQPEEPLDSSGTLQDQAHDAIARYRDMIKCFRGMNETLQQKAPIEVPTSTIEKDKHDIQQIMQHARDDGEKLARGHLAPYTYSSPVKDTSEISGHEQTGANMFQASRKTVRDSVGSVIEQQKDGLRQLISTLSAAQNQV
ncbi:hypothetical protein PFICI_08914 [Pestalotiopsis fici W106-1]|uniref:Uncharacterized protein n=1 Tax=Pestalotiopsis fici (strain W106-1 / CGMCC3.15140) TaxID=1229662 RepID=W3X1L6_PESFW|nr:uncharacterized protein PFICI_08914 [Pestalotiopsis fici W106-1]ETS79061.1 hypothetical protein PFICI_08914 [Pestalotiopsis fici W106-1]